MPVSARMTLAIRLIWVPATAQGQPVAVSDEIAINTYTTGPQRQHAVCSRDDGTFVVAWGDGRANYFGVNHGRDGSETTVGAGRFAADGQSLAGNDLVVNTYTVGRQDSPSVACLPNDGFVVVWTERDTYVAPHAGRFGVFGRRFNASGTPAGTEFALESSQAPADDIDSGSVCRGPNDGFVVVWNSITPFESTDAQRYDDQGQPVGTAFPLNAGNEPVCCGGDSGFVVSWWRSGIPGGRGPNVTAQRFSATGAIVGTEFIVNTYTGHGQVTPAVGCRPNGEFVVVWTSLFNFADPLPTQDGDRGGIFGRAFDASGGPIGTEFRANTYTTGHQELASVAMDDSGRFVVSWTRVQYDANDDPIDEQVFAQAFDLTAARLGTEFQVNTSTTFGAAQSVIGMRPNGDFVVVWQTDAEIVADDEMLVARRFDLGAGPTTTTTLPAGGICGDPIDPPTVMFDAALRASVVTATDALFILKTAVGTETCLLCVCDVNGSGAVTASDALADLKYAVGQNVLLSCPPCS